MKYKLTLLLFLISGMAFAQNLNIKFNLTSAPEKVVYLSHYYLGNIYIDDTLQLDANGSALIKRDTLLPQGLYKIYLDENNHFDILLGADQDFTITSPTFSAKDLVVEGATETGEFVKYVQFLQEMQHQSAELREKLKSATDPEKTALQEELSGMNSKVQDYWKTTSEKFPGTFLARFLMANLIPALDITTLDHKIVNNDSLLLLARFNYQKKHYWDNFDYTDERFLYTPLYKPKLETWFTKVLVQHYDSVKPYVFDFIETVRPKKRIFQFVTSWFLNSSINSNIMGMDALFVDIAREYYLSGQAFWASEESLEKIRENVLFTKNNLIGLTAPDLTLEGYDGEYFNLHQTNAKYTLLVIYEPDCSHCKVFVPELHEKVYQKYKDKGLEVFAIYSMDNKEDWTEFLVKHELFDWINVWDEHHTSGFKVTYDARKTPGVYVLDENKTIVAKKMTVEQIERFMAQNL